MAATEWVNMLGGFRRKIYSKVSINKTKVLTTTVHKTPHFITGSRCACDFLGPKPAFSVSRWVGAVQFQRRNLEYPLRVFQNRPNTPNSKIALKQVLQRFCDTRLQCLRSKAGGGKVWQCPLFIFGVSLRFVINHTRKYRPTI